MNTIAALLYFVAISVLTGIALSFGAHGLTPDAAALALGTGAVVAFVAWWQGRGNGHKFEPPRGWGWVPVVLYTLFAGRAFLWLIWWQHGELKVLSSNNLGDMSLHLTFIEQMRGGITGWPDSPIYSGGKLSYAVGVDYFNGLLALVGVDVVHSLVWVGLIGAVLSGFALWRWGGAFTLMGFLCMGGLVGFAALGNLAPNTEPFFQDYAGFLKFDWAWKSLPLALLVTQRGFLFALPAGLLLLSSWRSRFFGAGDGWRLPFRGELLLYASMPVFHVHTFLVLSFLLAAFFFCHAGARWKLTTLVGAALIPATVLLWLTTGMGQSTRVPMWGNMSDVEHPPDRPLPKVLGWQPGWMEQEPIPVDPVRTITGRQPTIVDGHVRFLAFWLGNFGLWPFVAGMLVFQLLGGLTREPLRARWVWWGALAFFLILPALGQWSAYRQSSLSELLTGKGVGEMGRHVALILFAAAALVGAGMVNPDTRLFRFLRLGGFALAGLIILNGLWVYLSTQTSKMPGLPVDALPLFLATVCLVAVLVRTARRWEDVLWPVAFVFPALYLFLLACNVLFAPSPWDNTKMMLWAVLIVMPFLWEQLLVRWPFWRKAGALFLLFFSGGVGLLGGLGSQQHGYTIARGSELDLVQAAVQKIPRSETIAAAPEYNHPLLLSGRRLVLGYPPHVQSHGLPIHWHEGRLNTLMNGEDEWRIAAAELGVRYLWWGAAEEAHWPRSRQSWRRAAEVIVENPAGELFDLEAPLVPVN